MSEKQDQKMIAATITSRSYSNIVSVSEGSHDVVLCFGFTGSETATAIHVSKETFIEMANAFAKIIAPAPAAAAPDTNTSLAEPSGVLNPSQPESAPETETPSPEA